MLTQPWKDVRIRPGRNWAEIAPGTWESKEDIYDIRLTIYDLCQDGPVREWYIIVSFGPTGTGACYHCPVVYNLV